MLNMLKDFFISSIIVLTLVLGVLVYLLGMMFIGAWGAAFFTGPANIVFWAVWTFVIVGVLNGISTFINQRISG